MADRKLKPAPANSARGVRPQKTALPDSDRVVDNIMRALEANFRTLKAHPFARGVQTDEVAAAQFADLLNRSLPVTDAEQIVAATVRWMANRGRSRQAFIKAMFEGHYACVSQYTDGRLIEKVLGAEQRYSISASTSGFIVGDPRSDEDRSRGFPKRGDRRGRGNGRRRTAPVLDDEACRDLVKRLDEEIAAAAAAAGACPPAAESLPAAESPPAAESMPAAESPPAAESMLAATGEAAAKDPGSWADLADLADTGLEKNRESGQ